MTRKRLMVTALVIAVFIVTSSVQMVAADLVWEDNDFATDWQMNDAIEVTDGMLRYNGASTYGHAFHNSSVNVGSWEFDIIEYDSEREYVNVMFIANVDRVTYALNDGYFVALTRYSNYIKYDLYKAFDYPNLEVLASYTPDGPVVDPTIHHIKVSRDASGQIDVYINNTLQMQADGGLPSEDPFGSEPVFYFFASRDVALDNVEVYDLTESPPFPMELVVVAVAGAAIAVVVIVLIVKRKG